MGKKIIDYIKRKWLFLVIVLALIIGSVWFWWKMLTPIDETCIYIADNPDIIFSLMLVVTSGAMVYYARRQHTLEKTKIKIELYDRRINIYYSLRKIIENIDNPVFYKQNSDSIKRVLRQTKFLFEDDKEIQEFIYEIVNQWNSIELFRNNKNTEYVKRVTIILKGMGLEIDSKFDKYLRIE